MKPQKNIFQRDEMNHRKMSTSAFFPATVSAPVREVLKIKKFPDFIQHSKSSSTQDNCFYPNGEKRWIYSQFPITDSMVYQETWALGLEKCACSYP